MKKLITVSAWTSWGIIPGWCALCRNAIEAEGLADRFREEARARGWTIGISFEVPS